MEIINVTYSSLANFTGMKVMHGRIETAVFFSANGRSAAYSLR
jgi:hypothetical protein